jgi:Flp pilus assembly protein TadG
MGQGEMIKSDEGINNPTMREQLHGDESGTVIMSRPPFTADRSGSAAIIFGLAFIPVMIMIGSAIDFQRATTIGSRMHESADAAVLAVSKQANLTQSQRQALATNIALANLGQIANQINARVVESEPTVNTYNITVSGSVPTMIMKIAHMDSIAVSKHSSASILQTIGLNGTTGCVLALDNQQVADSFWDIGNATTTIACDIIVNSASSSALDVNGSANLTANQIFLMNGGGYTASTPSRTTTTTGFMRSPAITKMAPQTCDPYAAGCTSPTATGVSLPTFSGCLKTNYSTSGTVTLQPGVYCNGISINANANVSLASGTYIIDRGTLSINGQATVTGPGQGGVTFVFTSSTGSDYATAKINGGATVNLSACRAGDDTNDDYPCIPGIVFFSDRNMPVGTNFTLNGGSTQTFNGAIYLPTAALNYTGGASSSNSCLQIIADTIKFTGNSNFGITSNNCATGSNSLVLPFGVATSSVAGLIQ